MVPRLRLNRSDRAWTQLFDAQRDVRELRVMVDADLLDRDSHAGDARRNLITGLLTHESIAVWRYADDGPPAGTPRLTTPWNDKGNPLGWAVAIAAQDASIVSHEVSWCEGGAPVGTAIAGNVVEVASRDVQTAAYVDIPHELARQQRAADAVAAASARRLKADIFITEREYLHAVQWTLAEGVTFCTPDDALALVSLFLRSRGDFIVWRGADGRATYRMNRGLFYWVGARELLPQGWRWFSACVSHDTAHGADDLTYLGGSVFQRVTRVLQSRDELLRAVNVAQNNDVAESVLMAMDTSLVYLMGALDATARVAHLVLGLPSATLHQAGWQRERSWLAEVARRAPTLYAVVAPGTPGRDTVTAIRLLRNTVHDAGLRALAIGRSDGAREDTLVGLPRADRAELLRIADERGGRVLWGLREVLPGELHADPAVLFEILLTSAVRLLNDLMRATPVDLIADLPPETPDAPNEATGPFSEFNRHSIRWQLGLGGV